MRCKIVRTNETVRSRRARVAEDQVDVTCGDDETTALVVVKV